ncbi:hypothetical protein N0M98_24330 [Paenibacillus doosanensis]|uniref:Uncharacterized protein n=1 Tax=Paenibacillus konkukensis TaxID=2020716 RepID=A0ABY4RU91_9BACL|nr:MULTISPECIES: hypothetical protein [Paenibacillus]MCS7463255.1 hypothetical protein [Paenibacillus doosanensis]UQZ85211.1 hypothetical protein SK3146_04494 [Paenibacillus konkukensis]
MSLLKTSRINLMERLAKHLKQDVALQAEGFTSGPGELQKVGKRFIRVNGHYYVPSVLQEIVLLQPNGKAQSDRSELVNIRTVYWGVFPAALVRNGTDFIEVIVAREDEEEELNILIPLNKVIGIESRE